MGGPILVPITHNQLFTHTSRCNHIYGNQDTEIIGQVKGGQVTETPSTGRSHHFTVTMVTCVITCIYLDAALHTLPVIIHGIRL